MTLPVVRGYGEVLRNILRQTTSANLPPDADVVESNPRGSLYDGKCEECVTGISCEESGGCLQAEEG